MNIACIKENTAVFHVLHKINQPAFYYKATLKVVNGVFSICRGTSDSLVFCITHTESLVSTDKGHYIGTTDCVFLSFNNVILNKHIERTLCMHQFACLSSEQVAPKTFPCVCWYFGLFFEFALLT